MKKKYKIIFTLIIIFLNFNVCSKSLNKYSFKKKDELYNYSKKKMKERQFNKAIKILENMKNNNIIDFNNDKIQINLIYAYYKNSNLNMAQKIAKEFIYFHPNHPNMDYVIYMQSLIHLALDKNTFFKAFPIKYYKRDPVYAKKAFFQLKYLVYNYPYSLYIINAKKHMLDIKNRLSEHDLKILKFYFSRKEYIAVINRGESIIRNYPETVAARQTLSYMQKSFFALKIFDTAEKISKIISLNAD